jgi:S1-C subfamily serine protease
VIERRRGRNLFVVALVVAAVVMAAAWWGQGPFERAGARAVAAAPAGVGVEAPSLEDAYVNVIGQVRPSVVEIATDSGLGSGVVYDGQGHIVTNAHVVEDATRFRVTLADGRSSDATLVGAYPPDDLAVIRVSAGTPPPAARFADSAQVKVGQIALAIGNPLGLASSVTDGIVSFTGRTVSEGGGIVLPSTIQTSAAINPGNSGGALVDLAGEVIGIPTLAAVDAQLGGAAAGIGFAIPSNTVKRIADQLIGQGKVTDSQRAALGISGTTVTTLFGQPLGVLIRAVEPHGPAETAGLGVGDVITAIDGHATPDLDALQDVLAGLRPGARVGVNLLRSDGTTAAVDVTLGSL